MKLGIRSRIGRASTIERAVVAPTLRTERLVLRPYTMGDADRWFEIQSSPDVRAYTSWEKRTVAQSRAHLRHRTKHVELKRADDFLPLAIEFDGKLVGDVGLHLRSVSPSTRFAEISWIMHPDHYGLGIAGEAAAAMMEFAFAEVEVRWLVAIVDPTNEASMGLASRLGFTQLENVDGALTFVASRPPVSSKSLDRAS